MTVASPRNLDMLRNLMVTAENFDGPFAIRYPRGNGDAPVSGEMHTLPVGKGEMLKDGKDMVVLTLGPIAREAAEAIAAAEKEYGITIAHYDMIFLKPMDSDIISRIAAMNVPVITVEDGTVEGGMGSAVIEALSELGSPVSVYRLGVPDRFIPQGTPAQLKKLCGFDADGIRQTIGKIVNTINNSSEK